MKKALFLILFLNLIYNYQEIQAQTTNEKYNWELYKESEGLMIFTKTVEFHDSIHDLHQEFILLKFENTTENTLIINWKTEIWYNNKCINCTSDFDEHKFSINIMANQTIEGNINSENDLKIFKRFLNYNNKSELTNFALANLTIERLNNE